jgi:NADH:ubiquinone oxidoreductase subunit 3 (subunit A)
LFKGRSYYSLAAHALATGVAIYLAIILMAKGNDIFQSGNELLSSDAGIFGLILFLIAAILFVVALIPFVAVLLGWVAYFSKVPWLTLATAICYILVSLIGTTDASNLYFLPSAALGFVGWLQERKTKSSAKPSAN